MPTEGRAGGSRFSLIRVLAVSALLFLLLLMPGFCSAALATARERARRTKCASNLKQIACACAIYSNDRDGAFPSDLGALMGDYVTDGNLFLCPSTDRRAAGECPPGGPLEDEHLSYCYVSGLRSSDPGNYTLGFDEEWNHPEMREGARRHEHGAHVARVGGDVRWTSDLAALHEELAKQAAELGAKGRTMKIIRPSWSRWPEEPPDLAERVGWPWWYWLAIAGVVLLAIVVVVRVVREYREWAERV